MVARNAVVMVAAGRGERMGGDDGPKQYRDLRGSSVLSRATRPFLDHPDVDLVLVVIHADDQALYAAAIPDHSKLLPPVNGGATRQQSVLNGLDALAAVAPSNVLIHDAARPFVTAEIISDVLAAIAPGQCALPACAVADTLKRAGIGLTVEATVSRDGLFAAQTPQGFMFDEILAAHRDAARKGIAGLTDDASVAEAAGIAVRIVPAPQSNSKLTTQADMEAARMKLGSRFPDVRTGNGYDVHQLEPGDGVTLCGVFIAHDQRLKGHSDADVGLHALTDALLGTIGDGDIGSHFPPSDMRWKGASSDRFLAHAVQLVRQRGGVITHLDVSLICEAPRIGPHRDEMRARIAEIAGIEIFRVAVKATTNEKIGFIGRGEGIAAIATATAVFGEEHDAG
ncbi:MAG TPA: bifunctional 2-C-methyl-D-erythritol 4-phosphate cytidylyltransferase/2-C-methyl-D-erythritol 2,4-cyclodiphosphate synthase [Rhizobiaceae bacterium]|nr:bifunctional 2-C-methyl-D-erythritol 4-phosphate cytidylyltransferase/2-C-methyl-D-erythritol 2,4-cyclodiphosphate synthase [Rhizobiaceae bacterium]